MVIGSVKPKGIFASKENVSKFAENIAEQLNFNAGDNIEELIENVGGKIVVGSSGTGDTESGSIVARSVNDFTIYISGHTSLKRDRFTIAHELGHLLLHLGPIKKDDPDAVMRATRWVDKNDQNQQRAEWEANWFAASFLMPRAIFEEFYNEHNEQTTAQKFGVSVKAVQIRAKSLGLIAD